RRLHLTVASFDQLLGCCFCGRVHLARFLAARLPAVITSLEFDELGKSAQIAAINSLVALHRLLSTRRDTDECPSRGFQQPGLQQVRLRPPSPMVKESRRAAVNQLLAICLSYPQTISRSRIDLRDIAVLSVVDDLEDWPHE